MKKLIITSTILAIYLVALVMPAYAQDQGPNANQAVSASALTCIQNAIENRDTAIISALNTFSTSMGSALTVRKNSLKNAWAIANYTERKNAIKTAWITWRTSARTIRQTFRNSKSSAWSTFKSARIACGVSSDGNGLGVDSYL